MATTLRFIVSICSLIIGGYLNWYFHEYVHWCAGKIFSGDPTVLYNSWHRIPYPYAVEYNKLTEMPDWGIRVAGISPHTIWIIAFVFSLINSSFVASTDFWLMVESLHSIPFLMLVFISASAGAGISVSPSDLVATTYPNKYRNHTGQDLSHLEWARILLGHPI